MILTNLLLLNVSVLVAAMVGAAIVLHPIDSVEKVFMIFGLVVGVYLVSIVAGSLIVRDKESVWRKPVSKLTGTIITNVVVGTWGAVVCGIALLLVHKKPAFTIVLALALLFLVGLGSGWWIRRRFLKDSLLPYGISFTLALFVVMAVLIGFRL